jgi:hypothetical protein
MDNLSEKGRDEAKTAWAFSYFPQKTKESPSSFEGNRQ